MTGDIFALFAHPLWGPILIMSARVVDVSLDTMRVLFMVRGRRLPAAALGFLQALVWIVAVGNAIKHLGSAAHVLGYATGFALGTAVGITIEKYVAYGLSHLHIISRHGGVEIAEALRERGYGATEFSGYGRDGAVEIVTSVVQRAHVPEVLEIVDRYDPQAFVTVEDPQVLRGGSVVSREWPIPTPVRVRQLFKRSRA
ncbi:MAG TPA: DUF5698 domain-containing protein [Gemmatimonadaceae bacterium]|nr:DUF5698 domain-containing protein [Gemmatimonadaceae bacterium]